MLKKVLIISPSNKGTIALRSQDLYYAFSQRKDLDTTVIYLHKFKDGFDIDGFEYCDLYQENICNKFMNFLKEIFWLRRIKKQLRPDVVISTLTACSVCNIISKGDDEKIGLFRAPYEQKTAGSNAIVRMLHHVLYHKLDYLVGVSEEVTNSMKRNFPRIAQNKFVTIYNAFFDEDIKNKAKEDIDVKDSLAFKRPVILSVGRIKWLKAPDRLIKSFAQSELRNKCNLVFIGPDTDKIVDDLKKIAIDLCVNDRVFFIGPKANPYCYMKQAALFVSSSKTEGLPGVLIESLLVGTPVITSNSSFGVWEILNCAESYNKDLRGVFEAKDGLITSNVDDEDVNVKTLTQALNYYNDYGLATPPFNFKSKITPEGVVDSYMKLFLK